MSNTLTTVYVTATKHRTGGGAVLDLGVETHEFIAPQNYDDFYRAEFPAMVALASTLVGNSAEDIAQEAMIRANQKWSTISRYEKPGTWVRRVTINLALSKLRRGTTQLRKIALLSAGAPDVAWQPQGFDDDLTDAITSLPKKQRAAVVLHYLEDLPVAEIANILECSPSTAKVHLHRGRQALAEKLGTPQEKGIHS